MVVARYVTCIFTPPNHLVVYAVFRIRSQRLQILKPRLRILCSKMEDKNISRAEKMFYTQCMTIPDLHFISNSIHLKGPYDLGLYCVWNQNVWPGMSSIPKCPEKRHILGPWNNCLQSRQTLGSGAYKIGILGYRPFEIGILGYRDPHLHPLKSILSLTNTMTGLA